MLAENTHEKPLALVVVLPAAGHYHPMIRLTEALLGSFRPVLACSEYELPKIQKLSPGLSTLGLKDQNSTLMHSEMKLIPFVYFTSEWYPQLLSYMRAQKPKVVVADFFSEAAMRAAHELSIPTVIYCPTGLGILRILDLPLLSKNRNVAGLTLVGPDPVGLFLPKYIQPLRKLGPYFDKSLVLFTTFFGLEDGQSLPSNFRLIGPAFEPLASDPSALDADFRKFLDKARASDKDVVYVTFGSVLQLTQGFINHLYEGLKKTDLAVVWSLRDGDLPEQNPHFFVRKWLPQKDILGLPEVKAVITHGGWGGFLECLMCEKPMLCVPGFGDQPMNSELVQRKGLGLILRPQSFGQMDKLLNEPNFTHQDLALKLNRLINDGSFLSSIRNMKSLAGECGGLGEAARLIGNAARHGVAHLVDRQVEVVRNRSVKMLAFVLLIWLAVALHGWICGCGHDHHHEHPPQQHREHKHQHGHEHDHSHDHNHDHSHDHSHEQDSGQQGVHQETHAHEETHAGSDHSGL